MQDIFQTTKSQLQRHIIDAIIDEAREKASIDNYSLPYAFISQKAECLIHKDILENAILLTQKKLNDESN